MKGKITGKYEDNETAPFVAGEGSTVSGKDNVSLGGGKTCSSAADKPRLGLAVTLSTSEGL